MGAVRRTYHGRLLKNAAKDQMRCKRSDALQKIRCVAKDQRVCRRSDPQTGEESRKNLKAAAKEYNTDEDSD
jgi:hypothetical protein